MELKTNYQYTYFVQPFIIKENKYQKYILKLLRNKRVKLKTFQKEKDFHLYKYFSPKVREFLFSSFSMPHSKAKKLEELPIETRSAMMSQIPCTIFEYDFEEEMNNTEDKTGIFFKVQKMELICFNTGICFLAIKTNIENSNDFSDVLNFNYKFRDINQEDGLNNCDNIKLHVENFNGINSLIELIKDLTGSSLETLKVGIDSERFLTYSYVCIDGHMWNQDNSFDSIKNNYIKFAKVLSADDNSNIKKEGSTISNWKYAKLGISKTATTLFTSNIEMNNYTILPEDYENQYFYTYILNLYKRMYLKKINYEFKSATKPKEIKETRKRFVYFTQHLWIQEVTEDESGNILNHKFKEAFEIVSLYNRMKNKYDILYKEMKVEKNAKRINIITFILLATLIFNILNFIMLIK